MKKTVIIVAAGKGLRMGSDLPKQFLPFQGKPVLMRTLEVFSRWDAEADLLTVIPEEYADYWKMLCRELNFSIAHRVVYGGETRFLSVRNGLNAVESYGLIAIHDGVRPFVTPNVINTCFNVAALWGAAIPVIPMIDSVREIIGAGEGLEGNASRPFDRTRLCIVQTPQVFNSDVLRKAYEQPYDERFTDDATVVEASGHPIFLVEGNRENIKITTPEDLIQLRITNYELRVESRCFNPPSIMSSMKRR